MILSEIKTQNIWTRLDETGILFGVKRLPGETLLAYKTRIMSAFVHTMNASQSGLVNSILTQLGLSKTRAITISLADGVSHGDFPQRAIFKDDNSFVLCSRYNTHEDYTSEYSVELRETPLISIATLVDNINAYSDIFSATLNTSGQDYGYASEKYMNIAKAFTLENTISYGLHKETIKPATVFELEQDYIRQGTVAFSDFQAFETELYNEEYLNNEPGNYYIDYDTSEVTVVTLPKNASTVTYSYQNEPFIFYHSPVQVSSIWNTGSMKYLFEEIQQEEWTDESLDRWTPGLPKVEMTMIAHELKRVANIYWGE